MLGRCHAVESSGGVGWATCSGSELCAGDAAASKMAAAWVKPHARIAMPDFRNMWTHLPCSKVSRSLMSPSFLRYSCSVDARPVLPRGTAVVRDLVLSFLGCVCWSRTSWLA